LRVKKLDDTWAAWKFLSQFGVVDFARNIPNTLDLILGNIGTAIILDIHNMWMVLDPFVAFARPSVAHLEGAQRVDRKVVPVNIAFEFNKKWPEGRSLTDSRRKIAAASEPSFEIYARTVVPRAPLRF
jgi:hypothetical protein